MGLILRNGSNILRAGGTIARKGDGNTQDCCCKCCCMQFNIVPPPSSLTATIDAPGCPKIDGKVISLALVNPQATECVKFEGGTDPICRGSGVGMPPVSYALTLRCTNLYPDGATRGSCMELELSSLSQASGCDSSVAKSVIPPDSCDCNPTLVATFSGFVLKDNAFVTGECDCCPGGFSIIITE